MGRRKKIIGPTSSASFSCGVHPVGMKNAVMSPQAMNAPMLGITLMTSVWMTSAETISQL